MVLMCTGIPEETRQNELYLQVKEMNAVLIRDKSSSAYDTKTTHLIVGALAKTEKFLCGIAAGIPMVDVNYIKHSKEAGYWLHDIDGYDIGNPEHPLRMGNSKLFLADLKTRQLRKLNGGVFKGWKVVVLIEDLRQQEVYRRLMEIGGAHVFRYTLQHMADLSEADLGQLTHIITNPGFLLQEVFRQFISVNDKSRRVPVVAYIYVGDFLTKRVPPPIHLYDIRQQAMIDLLATSTEKDLIRSTKQIRPPDYVMKSARPKVPSHTLPVQISLPVPGPSLQESPDLILDDVPEPDDDEPLSASLERNLSRVISCDVPDDFEYEKVDNKSSRKRGNSLTPSELVPKRIKVNHDASGFSEKFYTPNSTFNDSSDIVEIINETPVKSSVRKSQGVMNLKRKAQQFLRDSQATAKMSQSNLDKWVVKSPKPVVECNDSSDDQDVICVNDKAAEGSINRRKSSLRKSNSTPIDRDHSIPLNQRDLTKSNSIGSSSTTPNHFLVKTRSGLIRSSSVRSQKFSDSQSPHHQLMSQVSNASQDSFCSDAGSDVSVSVSNVSDEPGKKLLFCHNLLVQRRSLINRLDVGRCIKMNKPPSFKSSPDPLPASTCANIWTCLDSEQELKELDKDLDESWLTALDLLTKVVNVNRYAPVAAMHKIMEDAMRNHKDELVRTNAYKAFLHCLSLHTPGPSRPELGIYYLELMSKTRPHLDKWEFDCREPWDFLKTLICCILEEDNQPHSPTGDSLVFKFLIKLCELDMNNWYDHVVAEDCLESEYKPILARILFPSEPIGFTKRIEMLCNLYVEAIVRNINEDLLTYIRNVVGLASQLIQFSERSSKHSHSNAGKLDIASNLAKQFSNISMTSSRLWAELYLLQPTWLAALVSRKYLENISNFPINDETAALRILISSFLNADIDLHCEDTINDVALPSQTSTPLKSTSINKLNVRVRNTPLTGNRQFSKKTVTKVNSKNKYGETPLHIAAKKGQYERMSDCLNTPGVDINCQDNAGYSPLHEAVGSDNIEIVKLLLQYVPHSHTLDRYFAVSSPSTKAKKNVKRVDLLLVDKESGMNPVHEAVDNDNITITKLFLDSILSEQDLSNSGLPTMKLIMESTTKNGETLSNLAKSNEMKKLLDSYSHSISFQDEGKENRPLNNPVSIDNKELFGLLTEVSISKYIAMNCLPHIYAMYKDVKVSEVISAHEQNLSIKLNKKQERWGPLNLRDGLIDSQFGRRPRFEVFRNEELKSQDVKDFENLLYFKKQFKKIDPVHPVLPMLKLLKINTK